MLNDGPGISVDLKSPLFLSVFRTFREREANPAKRMRSMRCIYGHEPGTCDCMLGDAEVDEVRAAMRENNNLARRARTAVKSHCKRLEQRLFERAIEKMSAPADRNVSPHSRDVTSSRQRNTPAARAALEVAPRKLEQRLFERAKEKIDTHADQDAALRSLAPEEDRFDVGILFLFMLILTFLIIINVLLRTG
jgi:hypothetical protein